MPEWMARSDLATNLGLPYDTVKTLCRRKHWPTRPTSGQSGREIQVHVPSLPEEIRTRLLNALCPPHQARPGVLRPPALGPAEAAELGCAGLEQQRRAQAKVQLLELLESETGGLEHGRKTRRLEELLYQFNRGLVLPEALEVLGHIQDMSTIYRWRKAYEARGLAGLLDKRGRPRGYSVIPQPIQDFVWQCLQANPQIRAAHIMRLLPAKFKRQPLPAASTMRALVARLKEEHAETLEMLHQPSQHKRHFQPSLGKADTGLTRPNQRWELDSTRADILARRRHKVIEIVAKDGKRYTLIAAVDVFTRRPVALLEQAGGGFNINLLLIKAVRRLGVPEAAIMDLGKDYQSVAVQSFCQALGIDRPPIPGRSPELKPHVERFFDTVQSQLFALLPGYTANKVDNRREIILPTLSRQEIQEHIDAWIEAYERREHGETGQAPLERGNPAGWKRRTVPEEQLRMLLTPMVERGVRQLVIHHNNGRYWNPEIRFLEGSSKVLVADDPDDAGLIHVFDLERRFLFQAQDLERAGLTPRQIAEERKAFRRVRQARRREAEETAKALKLAELNRQALRMEIETAEPVAEVPVIEEDLPEIKAALEARAKLPRRGGLALVGGLEARIQRAAAELPDLPDLEPEPEPTAEADADADPLPRPALFKDLTQWARWTMKRLAHNLPVADADKAALEEFRQTDRYKFYDHDGYWEWDAQQLTLD
ncbi:MAG: Mu transposase C-terminal domain-containing protein [Pseudomonadota bacterium]